MRFRVVVPEGQTIPRGFGLAYYTPGRPLGIAYPIPINLLIGAARALYHWAMVPPWRFVEWRVSFQLKRVHELEDMLVAWADEAEESERLYFKGPREHTTATDRLLAEAHRLREARG